MKTKSAAEIRGLIDKINEKHPVFNGTIRAATDAAADDAKKTFELSFSSEEPYERWFGMEILGHKADEVDMGWIGSGNAPLLLQHNHDQQIGIIESAKLENGRGTAVVRFGRSALAQEIKQDVEDGIRKNVSVGYRVLEMKLVEEKENLDVYRVTKWAPFENSIVSMPADQSVGVGRSDVTDPKPKKKDNTMDKDTLSKKAVALGLNPDASLESILDAGARQAKAEAKAGHDTELKRQADIRAEADAHAAKIPGIADRAALAVRDNISLESFRREILDCYTDGTVRMPSSADLSKKEIKDLAGYSFVKAIREKADGKLSGLEAEMHEQALAESRANGTAVEGLGVPHSVLMSRDLTVTAEGTDVVATGLMGFIGLLRNKMVVQSLGARVLTGLTGNFQIPKMTAGGAAAWEGENDANAEVTQTLGQVAFSPKRVGLFTDISKQLIMQSTPDIEAMVREDLATSIALAMDYAAINGAGSGNVPEGILKTTGIGSVAGGTNGLAPTLDHIIDLETAVAVDNADLGALAYLVNTATRGKLKKTAVVSGQTAKVWAGGESPLNEYPTGVSNQVPSTLVKGSSGAVCSAIIFGNWNDLVLCQWGGLDLVVDPYTQATSNLIRLVANTYADCGVRHAESFAAMADALTA